MTHPPLAAPLTDYRSTPGRYDELVDHDGTVRPAWQPLVDAYSRLGGTEVEQRRQLANRLVAGEGASYVLHGDGADESRPWRLDPVPIVMTATEWATLERGLVQRARLLDALLDDLYGPRRLLAEGIVPVEAVLGHRGYQRACVGVVPAGGRRLVLYGADVVRDAAGRLQVLRDHTDTVTGAGYALLNRSVLTRTFADAYRQLRVQRLDGFFTGLRAALAAQAPADRLNPRTVVVTPGLGHATYFEHSYLASHLGYNLVEAGDLTTLGGRVFLRALRGLEPVDVVLRRVEDWAADPLELEPGGRGGVPGLLQAVREGGVGIANAPGSGIAANLALQPYLPAACERLLGEALVLPAVATLWCGDPQHRAAVLDHVDRMVLHDTDPIDPAPSAFGARLDTAELDAWRQRIERRPHRYVGQEYVDFATTPVLQAGALVPGTAVIRVQVACTPDGYRGLPGGLGRVADAATPVLTQATGTSKDVWVLAGAAERGRARLAEAYAVPQIDLRASLPSRAAEALFWTGRNAERAETAARMALTVLTRFERDPELADVAGGAWLCTALAGLRAASGALAGGAPDAPGPGDALNLLRTELVAAVGDRAGAVGDSLGWLVASAAGVREFLSTSTWRLLPALDADRLALPHDAEKADLFLVEESLDRVLVALSGFAGLAMESIVRGPGWRFLDLGRRLERALLLLGLVDAVLTVNQPAAVLQPLYETVLAASECLVAYRRRYRSDLELDALCDLLLRDDSNPRSLAFQLDRLTEDLAALPERRERDRQLSLVQGAAAELFSGGHEIASPSADGVHLGLRQVVLDVRGHLLELDRSIVATWFSNAGRPQALGSSA